MLNAGGSEFYSLVLLSLAIGAIVLAFVFGRALTMWFCGTEEIIAHQKKTNELLQRVIELAGDNVADAAAAQPTQHNRQPARNPLVSR